MIRGPAVLVAALAAAAPACAAPEVIGITFRCERGVEIPVTFVIAADGSVAVLTVEGRQIALPQAVSGSGARYAGAQYIWWTSGSGVTLANLMEGGEDSPTQCTEVK